MCCMALSISSQTCAHFSGLLELFYLPVVNSGPPLRGHVRITPYLYVCPSVCLSTFILILLRSRIITAHSARFDVKDAP